MGAAEVREAAGTTTGGPSCGPAANQSPFIVMRHRSDNKKRRFLAFLSHFKEEAGAEARIVQSEMLQLLGPGHATFLDSDDLFGIACARMCIVRAAGLR